MTSKVSIISQALNLLGLPPISDTSEFPGNNPAYNAANVWYDTLLTGLLADQQPWRFAMTQKQLNVNVTPPPTDKWTYSLQLPTEPNYIVNYIVHDGLNPLKYYDIFEDNLYANVDVVWMDYIFKPEPDKFPIFFQELLIYKLASRLAMPVTQSINIAKTWLLTAEEQQKVARYADSVQTPSQTLPSGELFYSHFGIINPNRDRIA